MKPQQPTPLGGAARRGRDFVVFRNQRTKGQQSVLARLATVNKGPAC
jgi:hypothetical protein